MTKKHRGPLLAALLAMLATPAMGADILERVNVPPGAVVAELHPLRKTPHGLEGALVLVADHRITAATRAALQDWYMFGFAEPVAIKPTVTSQALAEAELWLVDSAGKVVSARPLATPFAQLRAVALLGDRPTEFLLETTMGGFGQFTGTIGRALMVEKGAVKPISALDKGTGAMAELILSRAPKTDWRIIPASSKGSDIFQVRCLPAQGGASSFGEEYVSYRPCGETMCRSQRLAEGYCAWSDGFPMLGAFP